MLISDKREGEGGGWRGDKRLTGNHALVPYLVEVWDKKTGICPGERERERERKRHKHNNDNVRNKGRTGGRKLIFWNQIRNRIKMKK